MLQGSYGFRSKTNRKLFSRPFYWLLSEIRTVSRAQDVALKQLWNRHIQKNTNSSESFNGVGGHLNGLWGDYSWVVLISNKISLRVL